MTDDNTFTPILVGDVDKLLSDERFEKQTSRRLQSIFLYTWMQSVIDGYNRIKVAFIANLRGHGNATQCEDLHRPALALRDRMLQCAPHVVSDMVRLRMETVCTALAGGDGNTLPNQNVVVDEITALMNELKDLPTDAVNAQVCWHDCVARRHD